MVRKINFLSKTSPRKNYPFTALTQSQETVDDNKDLQTNSQTIHKQQQISLKPIRKKQTVNNSKNFKNSFFKYVVTCYQKILKLYSKQLRKRAKIFQFSQSDLNFKRRFARKIKKVLYDNDICSSDQDVKRGIQQNFNELKKFIQQ